LRGREGGKNGGGKLARNSNFRPHFSSSINSYLYATPCFLSIRVCARAARLRRRSFREISRGFVKVFCGERASERMNERTNERASERASVLKLRESCSPPLEINVAHCTRRPCPDFSCLCILIFAVSREVLEVSQRSRYYDLLKHTVWIKLFFSIFLHDIFLSRRVRIESCSSTSGLFELLSYRVSISGAPGILNGITAERNIIIRGTP